MIDLTARTWFDGTRVQAAVDKAAQRVLMKFGSYVRRRARSLIRRRRAVSEPNSPPSSHTDIYRANILFAYVAGEKTVYIGPRLLPRSKMAGLMPRRLEVGGPGVLVGRNGRSRSVLYRKRPAMLPAFQSELSKLAPSFAGEVKE